MARIQANRRAWVHLNLHNGRYSLKYAGERVFYAKAVHLRNCEFRVNDRLRAKFEANPKRRTVHAHVVGEIVALKAPVNFRGKRIRCNPFRWRGFVLATTLAAVTQASEVVLLPGGQILAKKPA